MDPKEGRGNGKFVGNCPLQSASEKRRVEKRTGNYEKEVTAQVDLGGGGGTGNTNWDCRATKC